MLVQRAAAGTTPPLRPAGEAAQKAVGEAAERARVGWLLGVDGGGTGCRAAVADRAGVVLGQARGGAANIMTDPEGTLASILDAAGRAFAAAGLDARDLGEADALLGLAGANVGAYAAELSKRLPFRRTEIVSDALIALEGALGPFDGAIGVVGTGTVFMGRRKGEVRTLGGWGSRVGDLGSGARIGQRLLEETLLAHDGVRPGSDLSAAVLVRFDGPQGLVAWAASAQPRDYASLAPEVFEAAKTGDAVAARVLAAAVENLEESLRALGLREGERLCLLGGLAPLAAARLSPELAALLHPARTDALGGAVALAAQRFGSETKVSSAMPGNFS